MENVLIKTNNERNTEKKNDANVSEIYVDYELGGYMQQKNIYILQSMKKI